MFSRVAHRVISSVRPHLLNQSIRNSNVVLGALIASTVTAGVVYNNKNQAVQCASIPSEGIPGTNLEVCYIIECTIQYHTVLHSTIYNTLSYYTNIILYVTILC